MKWVWRAPLAILLALAAVHVGLLAFIFAARLGYPLDLEWMEGGTLTHALRLMEGKALYASPSLEFISYLYTPLYPALLALLGHVVGLSYVLGRTVSVAAFALAVALAFRAVRREGGSLVWALAGAGLIAAAFRPTEAWYDLVRVDSFALAFMAAGLYVLRHHHRSVGGVAVAAAILGIGVFAKQTVVLHLGIGGVALLFLNWRLAWVYALVGGSLVGGGAWAIDAASDGWFRTYVFEVHQRHDFYWHRFLYETEWRMIKMAPVFVILPVLLWLGGMLRPGPGVGVRYWGFVGVASILACSLGWSTQWSNFNATIPGFYFLAVGLAVACSAAGRPWLQAGLALLVAGQLAWLRPDARHDPWEPRGWSPARYVPDRATRAAARRFLARIARLPRPILVPYHPFYPVLVGQRPHFHQMGINDTAAAGMGVPADLRAAIRERRYAAIVLDRPPDPRYAGKLRGYRMIRLRHDESPRTIVGFGVRPMLLFVRESTGQDPGLDPGAPSVQRPAP